MRVNVSKSPLDKMNPPITSTASNANEPTLLATITFLPSAPIIRKSPDDIWLANTNIKYCLNNLPRKVFQQILEPEVQGLETNSLTSSISPPSNVWIKAYSIICHGGPYGNFYKGDWDLENPCRYGICPWRIEEKVSLLVKNRKLHDGHDKL